MISLMAYRNPDPTRNPSRDDARATSRAARRTIIAWLAWPLLIATPFAGCDKSPSENVDGQTFVVDVLGERFNVRTADPQVIAALEAMRANGTTGIVSGTLVAGDGGFNAPWSWHLDPASLHVPDLTIELCDGRPSMVEADLDYWINTVHQYCPWASRVVETRPD